MPAKFKVTFVGNVKTGKTTAASVLGGLPNSQVYQTTIGANFITKNVQHNNKDIKYEIWDITGQEQYDSLLSMYLRNTDAVCIFVSYKDGQLNEDDCKRIENYYKEASSQCPEDTKMIFVINIKDFECNAEQVISDFKERLSKLPESNPEIIACDARKYEGNVERIENALNQHVESKQNEEVQEVAEMPFAGGQNYKNNTNLLDYLKPSEAKAKQLKGMVKFIARSTLISALIAILATVVAGIGLGFFMLTPFSIPFAITALKAAILLMAVAVVNFSTTMGICIGFEVGMKTVGALKSLRENGLFGHRQFRINYTQPMESWGEGNDEELLMYPGGGRKELS